MRLLGRRCWPTSRAWCMSQGMIEGEGGVRCAMHAQGGAHRPPGGWVCACTPALRCRAGAAGAALRDCTVACSLGVLLSVDLPLVLQARLPLEVDQGPLPYKLRSIPLPCTLKAIYLPRTGNTAHAHANTPASYASTLLGLPTSLH